MKRLFISFLSLAMLYSGIAYGATPLQNQLRDVLRGLINSIKTHAKKRGDISNDRVAIEFMFAQLDPAQQQEMVDELNDIQAGLGDQVKKATIPQTPKEFADRFVKTVEQNAGGIGEKVKAGTAVVGGANLQSESARMKQALMDAAAKF